uniref:Uncharacterized protein n=1 Tax=Ciona intestinalis TaxID=7719 RepID=H2XK20_CIOIN
VSIQSSVNTFPNWNILIFQHLYISNGWICKTRASGTIN